MDFPVCPACGQSVIDDDVEDCPFCGSSMKAKPGTKPAAAKPAAKPAAAKPGAGTGAKGAAASTKPASSTAAKSRDSGSAATGKSGSDDDFPFDAEVPGAKTAIQAMPNASKGRTLQVVCPMCETSGYVPPTAVGKDVKCANPKCMVPVFKAPAPVVEAPPPPPPKKSNLVMVGGITAVVMVVLGGLAVFLSGQGGGTKPIRPGELSEEAKQMMREMADSSKSAPSDSTAPATLSQDNTLTSDKKPSGDATPTSQVDFIAAALKQLGDSSLVGDRRQRSKAYCRQLAADAFARVGDTKSANEHLNQLVVVGRTVPYYRIEPNLEMFWIAWMADDKPAATRALDAAVADAPKLQKVGRNHLEVASRLAAALVAAGRLKEGLELVKQHQSSSLEGQLAARVQLASDGHVTRLTKSDSVLPWVHPQAVATTGSLAARGQLAAARTWAEAQPDDESKAECLAFWAERLAREQAKTGPASSNPEIVEAVKGLSPALAARVWARAACGRFAAGDVDGAAATLKIGQDLIATVAVPPEPEMPNVKTAITYSLPDEAPLIHAATAAAEISFAQTLWPNHQEQAEAALDLSLSFARGLAPAWSAVSVKVREADEAGLAGLRELIKRELGLKSDDVANQNVSRYRKSLTDISKASKRRHETQERILSRLLQAGLKDKVWSVVSNRSAETNASRRDDFLNSPLIGELTEAFQGTETEKIIHGALGGTAPPWPDAGVVRYLLLQPNIPEAAQYVSGLDSNSGRRDDIALQFATYLASTDKADATLGFISKLDDIVLREEAYRLSAAILAKRGHAAAVWDQVAAVPQATEKASLSRGIVVGLKAGPPPKSLPEPPLMP
jgi:hypothetical protein